MSTRVAVALGLALLVNGAVALAQSGGGLDLAWHVVAGGGTSAVAAGDFSLAGTVGQSPAGVTTAADLRLNAGFWAAFDMLIFPLGLVSGWNLVAVPFLPADVRVGQVLQGVHEGSAWEWTGDHYRAAAEILPGHGYWIWCRDPADLVVQGWTVPESGIPLEPRWTLVGVIAGPPFSAVTLPVTTTPPGAVIATWGWSSLRQKYEIAAELACGSSYWVFARVPCLWRPGE